MLYSELRVPWDDGGDSTSRDPRPGEVTDLFTTGFSYVASIAPPGNSRSLSGACAPRRSYFALNYTAFAAANLMLAFTAQELSSFERYLFGTVPLLLAAAMISGGRLRSTLLLAVAPGLLGAYATMAFLRIYTP